jgi:RHS repeat-associated protein
VSNTTDYVYDGTTLIREMTANTGTASGVMLGALIPSVTYLEGPNGPAYRRNDIAQSGPRWYVYNGLGSVVGEVDAAGDLTSYEEYDVYGAPRAYTQTGTATSSQGYVGQLGHQTDSETGGLIYMQARYYDPTTGRFASEDPGRNGVNWYEYCGNDPTCACDSDGKAAAPIGFLKFIYLFGFGFDIGVSFTLVAIGFAMEKNYVMSSVYSAIAAFGFAMEAVGLGFRGGAAWVSGIADAIAGGIGLAVAQAVAYSANLEVMPGAGYATAAIVANCLNTVMLFGYLASMSSGGAY